VVGHAIARVGIIAALTATAPHPKLGFLRSHPTITRDDEDTSIVRPKASIIFVSANRFIQHIFFLTVNAAPPRNTEAPSQQILSLSTTPHPHFSVCVKAWCSVVSLNCRWRDGRVAPTPGPYQLHSSVAIAVFYE